MVLLLGFNRFLYVQFYTLPLDGVVDEHTDFDKKIKIGH